MMTLLSRRNQITLTAIFALMVLAVFLGRGFLTDNSVGNPSSTQPVRLAPDFPADFPIYRRGKLRESEWTLNRYGHKMYSIQVEIDTPIQPVAKFYEATLPAKGWIVEGPVEQQPGVKEYSIVRPVEQNARDVAKSGFRLIASKTGSKTLLSALVRIKESP